MINCVNVLASNKFLLILKGVGWEYCCMGVQGILFCEQAVFMQRFRETSILERINSVHIRDMTVISVLP